MKALILKGRDIHTVRLEQGLQSAGLATYIISDPSKIPTNNFDFAFIDPSFSGDPTKLNADKKFFFDSEDDPKHFDPDQAYHLMKDKVLAYAKMSYVENDHGDGLKRIGFPLAVFMNMRELANIEKEEFKNNHAIPLMVASPTFIGNYIPTSGIYEKEKDITSLGKFDDCHLMYNQRVDWLLSLQKNNIPYIGGLVFSRDNLSLEWQSKYFGSGINRLATNPIHPQIMYQTMDSFRVHLCPTGHERISWRTYDIMATGGILIRTDNKKQLALFNPKEYITIYDGEDLGARLLQLQPQYKEIWKSCQENRKVFKDLNPPKLIHLFMDQLK